MARVDANVSLFSFECSGLDTETFQVVAFDGAEELSRLYSFHVELVSTDPEIAFKDVVNKPATLTMMRGLDAVPIGGIVAHFEQLGGTADQFVYHAVLVPSLWRLGLFHRSRVFQKMKVDEIISEILKDGGLTDYRIGLNGSYAPKEYCVQYRESDLDFISRLMEHEGLYYFFEQSDSGEILVIADDRSFSEPITGDSALPYDHADTLRGEREIVRDVSYQERIVTGKVVLKDYNYRTPDTDLKVESSLNSEMPGLYYDYGEGYADAGEGKRLAKVRNEELEAGRRLLSATSNCEAMRAGYLFELEEHFRPDLNDKYLITRVQHRGTQRRALGLSGASTLQAGAADSLRQIGLAGQVAAPPSLATIRDGTSNTILPGERAGRVAGNGVKADEEPPDYENLVICIPASVQYRPPRRTPQPHIPGIMTAKLETAGGDYAYVDDEGEYRAKMYFDLGDATDGTATLPIRMAQPYSGAGYGMHFPNHAGAEVVFACIDGDVNRPVALGTVPNPNNGSPVKADNKMQNLIRTMAGNEILLDDTKEKSQIQIKTTDGNGILLDDKDDCIVIATTDQYTIKLDDKEERIGMKTRDGHLFMMDDKEKQAGLQTKDEHFIGISDKDKWIKLQDKDGKNSIEIDIGNNKIIIKTDEGNIDLHAPKGTIDIKAKAIKMESTGDTTLKAANFKGDVQANW
ncbi:MAG TPA: type VI secretion system tip protein TssI/VgrG, partial [Rhodothermales bacterium]|nr:type VI secretion system tip protein TssI/VgrG [Rhodothermales bacterium]